MLDIKKLFSHKEESESKISVDAANEYVEIASNDFELSDKEIECCGMATD